MKLQTLLRGAVCVSVLFMSRVLVRAEEAPKKDKTGHAGAGYGAEEKDPHMEEMMKYAMPGPQHENLKAFVGQWKVVSRWRMSPDEEWQQSSGMSKNVLVLGGRFVHQEVRTTCPDMPDEFQGIGYFGFDTSKQKHTSAWMDNMGTMIMLSEGTSDGSGKTITYDSEYDDPTTGMKHKIKMVKRVIGDGEYVDEMFDIGPDGKETMSLEVKYSRVGS